MPVPANDATLMADTAPLVPPPADAERAVGGTRTSSGSNYGDFAPRSAPPGMGDPSRGAEMERDVEPANARFDRAPDATALFDTPLATDESSGLSAGPKAGGSAGTDEREMRIREAAFQRYQQRGGGPGDALADWLAAEAEVDAAGAVARGAASQAGAAPARQRNAEQRC